VDDRQNWQKVAGEPFLRCIAVVHSLFCNISLRARVTMQSVLLRGGGGGREESVLMENRLLSKRPCLVGICVAGKNFDLRSALQGGIASKDSQVLMASSRMLSSDRFGCLGARSHFCRGRRCWEKKEASEGLHALRFGEAVYSFSSS